MINSNISKSHRQKQVNLFRFRSHYHSTQSKVYSSTAFATHMYEYIWMYVYISEHKYTHFPTLFSGFPTAGVRLKTLPVCIMSHSSRSKTSSGHTEHTFVIVRKPYSVEHSCAFSPLAFWAVGLGGNCGTREIHRRKLA